MDLSKSYEFFRPESVDGRIHIIGCGSVGSSLAELMVRSGLTAQQVQNRMAAQAIEEEPVDGEQVIINDDVTAVLPQVMRLIINNE